MRWILETDNFVSYWRLYHRSGYDWLGWFHIICNLIIAIVFFLIARGLVILYEHKKQDKNYKALLLYSIFKFMCGLIFLTNTVMFWNPYYKLYTLTKLLTAISSIISLYYLYPTLKRFKNYKTPEEYQSLINQLNREIDNKKELLKSVQNLNHQLADRVQYLENIAYTNGWVSKTELKLSELKEIIINLRKSYQ